MTALDADTLRNLRNRAEAAGGRDDAPWLTYREVENLGVLPDDAGFIAAADPATVLALLDAAEAVERIRTLADKGWHEDEAGAWVVYVWRLRAALAPPPDRSGQ